MPLFYKDLETDGGYGRRRIMIRWDRIIACSVLLVLMLICAGMFGCPTYNVWQKEMSGRAQLSEAEYAKQVQVQEAQANLEAERLNAEAEVVRAQGAADAIDIEGGKITPSYIQYLWVKKLSLANADIIYLPTEGGVPVLTQDVTDSSGAANPDNPDKAAEQQEDN